MALLSLSKAAQVTGVHRTILYRAINAGKLSRNPDGTLDTAELERAGFPLRHTPDTLPLQQRRNVAPGDTATLVTLSRLVETLQHEREYLQRALEDERRQRAHDQGDARHERDRLLSLLEQSYRLLEGRTASWEEPRGHVTTPSQQPLTFQEIEGSVAERRSSPPMQSEVKHALEEAFPELLPKPAMSKATQDFSERIPLETEEEPDTSPTSPKSWQALGPLCKYGHNHRIQSQGAL